MENMLNAHVQIYHKLKSLPGGDTIKIGIVKIFFNLIPIEGGIFWTGLLVNF